MLSICYMCCICLYYIHLYDIYEAPKKKTHLKWNSERRKKKTLNKRGVFFRFCRVAHATAVDGKSIKKSNQIATTKCLDVNDDDDDDDDDNTARTDSDKEGSERVCFIVTCGCVCVSLFFFPLLFSVLGC